MSNGGLLRNTLARAAGCLVGLSMFAGAASAQLRVVNWNVTNYSSGRVAEFQTSFYGVVPAPLPLAGKSMSPDVILGEEFVSQAAVNNFVNLLNTAPGSPADWAAAPFIDGPDSDSAFFYRTSKVVYIQTVVISQVTGSTSLPPRNTYRYDVRLAGYADLPATRIGMYATHMKSGSATADQSRRLLEANKIRDNANGLDTNGPGTALPAGWNYLIGGDFNIQSSTQAAYQRMVGSEANNSGRFWDPINSPGNWNNSSAFSIIHTQDPSTTGAGGMDDRHDQILLGSPLIDGAGLDYIGNPAIPYSTTTWNDPNHSYRAWGNDGTTFNTSLATTTNTMVGPAIAQALITTTNAGASSGGHLPVFLDLRVPAKVTSQTSIDFGTVAVNAPTSVTLNVSNAANATLWTSAGVETLRYSLAASAGLSAPAGTFTDNAGGAINAHSISINTSTPGPFTGTVTIASNALEQPVRVVTITGVIEAPPACPADFDGSGFVDSDDFILYAQQFELGCDGPASPAPACVKSADFDGSGFVDSDDFIAYVQAFEVGCQ